MIIAETFKEDLETGHLNASILDWINVERFATFPKVTRGNIHQILQTKKFIVLAVVEENKLLEIPTEMLV
jgi:thioredoxin domain-containing protein 10